MPIAEIIEGGAIEAVKINEIIDALNAISISRVNFNGFNTIAIRGATSDIGGVSRQGGLAGYYRITFATPKASANYAVVASCSVTAGNDTGFATLIAITAGYCEIYCRNDDGGAADCELVSVLIVGG